MKFEPYVENNDKYTDYMDEWGLNDALPNISLDVAVLNKAFASVFILSVSTDYGQAFVSVRIYDEAIEDIEEAILKIFPHAKPAHDLVSEFDMCFRVWW